MRIVALTVALTCLAVMAPQVASAQEAPAAKPADPAPAPAEAAPPADPVPAPAAPAPKAAPAAVAAPAIGDIGGDLKGYGVSDDAVPPGGRMDWAKRRRIRVIQKRAMLKEARHQFTLLGGVVPNDDFFAYIAMGLAYNYYFSEALALEISAAYTLDQKTSLEDEIGRAHV